jgi:hypothetical protein
MLVNSKTGLQQVIDLWEVSASDAHQEAEAAACVCVPGIAEGDQNFLLRVTTEDETCIYCYKPETKQ